MKNVIARQFDANLPGQTLATRRALFPISVDNDQFTTANIIDAVSSFINDFDEVIFLIADRLQLYNKAEDIGDSATFAQLIRRIGSRMQYVRERTHWLARMRPLISGGQKVRWKIISIDDVTDAAFFRAYRNVVIAFNTVPEFRNDVQECALAHVAKQPRHDPEQARRLAEAYILEEIAINLRVRVLDGVDAEFYYGKFLDPLVRLYQGRYDIDVALLAGTESRARSYRFFVRGRPDQLGAWAELLP